MHGHPKLISGGLTKKWPWVWLMGEGGGLWELIGQVILVKMTC